MQTITQRPRPLKTTRRTSKALPRPDLPGVRNPNFNLAWYFRKLGECEALQACRRAEWLKRRENAALTYALTDAIRLLEDEIVRTSHQIRDEGLLLYAHADTTIFFGGLPA